MVGSCNENEEMKEGRNERSCNENEGRKE